MGSLGNDDEDEIKQMRSASTVDIGDTEAQNFDSQFSPPSVSDEKFEDADPDELQFMQSTLPFDDTVQVDDPFETQLLNIAGETQVLDDPDCVDDFSTQLIDDFDNEVVVDSEDEGTDRTEVLDDIDESSDDDSLKRVGCHLADGEKTRLDSPRQQNEKEHIATDALTDKDPTGGLGISSTMLLDQCTPEPSCGSLRRGFTSIRAASLRASGLAAHGVSLKGTNSGSFFISSDSHNLKQNVAEISENSLRRDLAEVGGEGNQDHDLGNKTEKVKGLRGESKGRIGSSAVRKLFADEDTLAKNDESRHVDDTDCEAGFHQPSACNNELAGLSYLDSQEPGDASQANALEFVDKLIQLNVVELDEEVHPGNFTRGKSNPASCAKGPQSLAKRASIRSTVEETGIFDFDDNQEDEGGGDILCRRKEELFDSKGKGRKSFTQPRKPKHVGLSVDEKNHSISNRIMGIIHSDSRVGLDNSKENDKKAPEGPFRKNLISELDGELNQNLSTGQLEPMSTEADTADMLDIGFDTQLAAEAMEALSHGADLASHGVNDDQGTGNFSEGRLKTSSKVETKKGVYSKKVPSRKRTQPSDPAVFSRKTKKIKQTDGSLSKEVFVSPEKGFKKARRQLGAGLDNSKQKRVKLNAEQQTDDRSIGTPITAKHVSVKKQHVQEEFGTSTPVARRTRWCKMVNNVKGAECAPNGSRKEKDDLMEVVSLEEKGKGSRGGNVTKAKRRSIPPGELEKFRKSLSFNQPRDIQNIGKNGSRQSDPKLSGTADMFGIDTLCTYTRRRTRRNMSAQLNNNSRLIGPPSVEQEENEESRIRRRRSRSDVKTKSLLPDPKMKTISSSNACPVMSSFNSSSKVGVLENNSAYSDWKGNAASAASTEEAKKNASLEVSPKGTCKPSDSACTTPASCKTPVNAASPICMGNEYLKQSCKRNLSRTSLIKEVNSLSIANLEPTSASKNLRRRRDMTNVRVLFSHHLGDEIIKHQKKILTRLSVSTASSISDATHFVTDQFVRTRNMLEAIAYGKPVVTHLWLESCGQASCFIDEKSYLLRDAKKEKEFGFSMPVSLARACHHPLLEGRRVSITPNTKPGKEILTSLVKAVHGQVVEGIGRSNSKDDSSPDNLLILSCEEDSTLCTPFLERGTSVYSSELLLNGIVTQKLDYESLWSQKVEPPPWPQSVWRQIVVTQQPLFQQEDFLPGALWQPGFDPESLVSLYCWGPTELSMGANLQQSC